MRNRRHTLIGTTIVGYCGLALALLLQLPVVEHIGERLPIAIVVLVVTFVGPAALFSAGFGAWPRVAGTLALIAIFLGLSRLAWRRSPETEWFAVWLVCALVVWAGSGWLLVAFAS